MALASAAQPLSVPPPVSFLPLRVPPLPPTSVARPPFVARLPSVALPPVVSRPPAVARLPSWPPPALLIPALL